MSKRIAIEEAGNLCCKVCRSTCQKTVTTVDAHRTSNLCAVENEAPTQAAAGDYYFFVKLALTTSLHFQCLHVMETEGKLLMILISV